MQVSSSDSVVCTSVSCHNGWVTARYQYICKTPIAHTKRTVKYHTRQAMATYSESISLEYNWASTISPFEEHEITGNMAADVAESGLLVYRLSGLSLKSSLLFPAASDTRSYPMFEPSSSKNLYWSN